MAQYTYDRNARNSNPFNIPIREEEEEEEDDGRGGMDDNDASGELGSENNYDW